MPPYSYVTALILRTSTLARSCAAALLVGASSCALAGQIDIVGPPGSDGFGRDVLVLPNGNFVVSAPWGAGSVHLYRADGSLISTLSGSAPDDRVGWWMKSLGNGNFIVISPAWNHSRGAVTFVNGTVGLSGVVSVNNSLVGSQENDSVGLVDIQSGIGVPPPPLNLNTVVGDSNYVVVSNLWSDGNKTGVGAVTWCSGVTGCAGPLTSANSLIGGTAFDHVGQQGVALLGNGNYVVQSQGWDDPAGAVNAGALTWANGGSGLTGTVSAANSLIGTHTGDAYGSSVVPLRNGHYVVAMPGWDNQAWVNAGAAVWANGMTGIAGTISSSNALVGWHDNDVVGYSVTALSNGNYVVCTPYLDAGSADVGYARWADGNTGVTGAALPLFALTGPASGKGPHHAVALANGNYVVVSPGWDDGGAPNLGAVTWLSGSGITWGTVMASNSLVGTSANDEVGTNVVALSNGNYVVGSPNWDGVAQDTGAATWADGITALAGPVSAANSLVGATQSDQVGYALTALSNGNYLVLSEWWDNLGSMDVGAATWGNGAAGLVGTVSAANSLIGASTYDHVGGSGATALSNGNYVVGSYTASVGGHANSGAVTWGNGSTGTTGMISSSNSLYGSAQGDFVSAGGTFAMPDGSVVVDSFAWHNNLGAISLGSGTAPLVGPVSASNSVVETIGNIGMSFAYDATRHRLVVGRPASNIVSLFTLDADGIFANGFEP